MCEHAVSMGRRGARDRRASECVATPSRRVGEGAAAALRRAGADSARNGDGGATAMDLFRYFSYFRIVARSERVRVQAA